MSTTVHRATNSKTMSLVDFLGLPGSYPDRPSRVEVVETHISRVFLTRRYAYKLKKPVQMGFLDFSTLESREAACREEVRLNRRLAPGVYVDVVPVFSKPGGGWQIGDRRPRARALGASVADRRSSERWPVADWLVKMRRLPADLMLDHLILTSGDAAASVLSEARLRPLIDRLVQFYRNAPPLVLPAERYRGGIEAHIRANRDELLNPTHGLDAKDLEIVRRVHAAQLELLQLAPEIIDARVTDGRIVDGHGDLRPEHICMEPDPVVFDCLEFSAELRRVDVMDELSFLAMECTRLGADFVGQRVLAAYQAATHDLTDRRLTPFYMCYRACVRAKVAVLRGDQNEGSERETSLALAREYLHLAARFAAAFTAGPKSLFVVVLRGLAGSGKTTLARELASLLKVNRLSTDDARQEMFAQDAASHGYGEGKYSPEARLRVYERLITEAKTLLSMGHSVVIDGSFLTREQVELAQRLAADASARLLVVECHCPDEVADARIENRLAAGGDSSEARRETRARQQEAQEPLPEGVEHIALDASQQVESQAASVLRTLQTP